MHYRAIILVLASEDILETNHRLSPTDLPVYPFFKKVCEQYMFYANDIKFLFVYGSRTKFEPKEYDIIYDDIEETLAHPCMLKKTLRAYEYIDKNFSYDFLIRTNLNTVWDFDYNDLPNNGSNGLQFVLPANATIVSAKLYVDVAFTSTSTTTDLNIGLYTSAGVAIDADGLIAAAEATQTAIGTAGNVVTGAGALVGKTIGTAAGELVVAPSVDDLLTGAGRIVVEYVYNKD